MERREKQHDKQSANFSWMHGRENAAWEISKDEIVFSALLFLIFGKNIRNRAASWRLGVEKPSQQIFNHSEFWHIQRWGKKRTNLKHTKRKTLVWIGLKKLKSILIWSLKQLLILMVQDAVSDVHFLLVDHWSVLLCSGSVRVCEVSQTVLWGWWGCSRFNDHIYRMVKYSAIFDQTKPLYLTNQNSLHFCVNQWTVCS